MNIEFNRGSEKQPKHDEEIIWFNPTHGGGFGSLGFQTRQGVVEYQWEELDDDGYPTGVSFVYQEGEEPIEGCQLIVLINGIEIDSDNVFWANSDAVFDMLEKELEK